MRPIALLPVCPYIIQLLHTCFCLLVVQIDITQEHRTPLVQSAVEAAESQRFCCRQACFRAFVEAVESHRFCCCQARFRACVEAGHNAVLPMYATKQYSSRPQTCMTCGAGCFSLGSSPVQSLSSHEIHAKRCSLFFSFLQGASKGAAVDRILKKLADEGNAPDFVLCIGDDRSDEDMFTAMEHVTFSPHLTTEVIATPGCCNTASHVV
jgi:hypothetical protein